ncbi:MAG: NHLP bacteriocin export ABC transporter permease/ATPase subunit [Enhydrobacter sp.]|nr:MAG: NHLP bacteriocin export ABC transporter permease/ATPase subunit [Enhydrobacter sp.]
MSLIETLAGDEKAVDAVLEKGWSAPALPLAKALDLIAARRLVNGNDVLDVTTRGRVWLVLSGSVDIFLVDEHGRTAILSVSAGGLVDSFVMPEAARLLGVPTGEAEIVETTRSAVLGLVSRDDASDALGQAWLGWRQILAQMRGVEPKGLDGWQSFEETCDREAAAALAAAIARRRQALADRALDLAAAERRAERDFDHGLESMIDLIGVQAGSEREDQVDTVAAAAERVMRALGVGELSLRADSEYGGTLTAAVEQVAQDNRLQFRVVELVGDWWEHDAGPLLVTLRSNGAPCAIVPAGKRYVLHAGGRARRLSKAIAAEVNSTAFSFYAPFHDEKLTAWRILRFGLQRGKGDVVTVGLTLFLAGLFSLVTPIATGWLMDPIVPDAERGQAVVIMSLLFLLAIGMTSSFIVQSLATLRLETLADNRVQAAVWIKLLNLKAPFFRNFTAGDLANRADGINAMRKLISQSSTTFASAGMSMLFSLALMIYYEWRLALLVSVFSVLFVAVAYLVGRRVLHYNLQSLEFTGKLQGTVLQLLASIAKLRVAGAERQAFLQWLGVYRDSVAVSLHQRQLNNRLTVLRSAFGPLLTGAVLVLLGVHSGELFSFFHQVSKPEAHVRLMSTADFVSFNVALGQFVAAVMSMTRAALMLVMLQPYYKRVQPILEAEEEPTGRSGRIVRLAGEIELRDVRFRYGPMMPLVLRGLSLRVPAGSFVAVVGPSGAGKSSLVRLLLGFEVPESGDIYIDGTDIRLIDPQDLRRHLGVVLQNGRLLAGSIYDNVSAGLPYSQDEVMEALRIAALDDVVKALPMGLHTNIGDGGVTFSGGQRQRLLIARAVMRNPHVLILDEATSALDNVAQRKVVENLRELKCTQFVIAQRLSTVVSADIIYVVDEGRVVEHGSYAELLAKGGLFKQLAARQLL